MRRSAMLYITCLHHLPSRHGTPCPVSTSPPPPAESRAQEEGHLTFDLWNCLPLLFIYLQLKLRKNVVPQKLAINSHATETIIQFLNQSPGTRIYDLIVASSLSIDIISWTELINEMKWNESGFRPPLCTYRLKWARRTSWGWWDWIDTLMIVDHMDCWNNVLITLPCLLLYWIVPLHITCIRLII